MPLWALTFAFWLHMAATVVWIGGLFFHAAIFTPAIAREIPLEGQIRLMVSVRRRFGGLAWLSLAVLIGTGLLQMSANPNYEGLVRISSPWSAALLLKHLAILLMVGVAIYQTWFVQPELERILLRRSSANKLDLEDSLLDQQRRVTRLNLGLGMMVLALTAVARTAS